MTITPDDMRRFKDWAGKVTKGQKDSAVFLNIWNDAMALDPSKDPAPVMQLGYAMLLDKPIVIIAAEGSRIPQNVVRCATVVEFYPAGDMDALQAATIRALRAVIPGPACL